MNTGHGRYSTLHPHMFLLQRRPRRASSTSMSTVPTTSSTPPPKDCPSYAALTSAVTRAVGCANSNGQRGARFNLTERVARGENIPYAALTHNVIPTTKHHKVDTYKARIYGGRFVGPLGTRFVTSCQDHKIRVYDTGGCEKSSAWTLTHVIVCEEVRWTVTDFDVSRCGRWLAYSTINPYIHIVDLDYPERHRRLDFSQHSLRSAFGVMSLCWSHDGSEIIVGTTSSNRSRAGHVMVYNVDVEKGIDSACAHEEDVNSVCFMKEDERYLLLSGSDDAYAKIWDRRQIKQDGKHNPFAQPCGVFIGHTEGLTHISTKNDGRFLISQGKDQCIKLWDARKTASVTDSRNAGPPPKNQRWDYRYAQFPGTSCAARRYRNDAVMSYSGAHETLHTLIRSYFSPMYSTGQKYIYTGSRNGSCAIYDVLTGKPVACLRGHQTVTRDVSWHPRGPFLTTVSWDQNIFLWSTHRESVDAERHCLFRGLVQRCPLVGNFV